MYMARYLIGTRDFPHLLWLKWLSLILLSDFNCFDRINTSGAYLIAPAMGSHFVMYLAKLQGLITTYFAAPLYFDL